MSTIDENETDTISTPDISRVAVHPFVMHCDALVEWLNEDKASALEDDPSVGIFANEELAECFDLLIAYVESEIDLNEMLAFVHECSKFSGNMVNGNQLALKASKLLGA